MPYVRFIYAQYHRHVFIDLGFILYSINEPLPNTQHFRYNLSLCVCVCIQGFRVMANIVVYELSLHFSCTCLSL